jgi:hypothetical protein
MPLLGSAAMLLSFDVLPDAIAEHDDWHTHEHLPERLSIPGFLRGSRWVATRGGPRYVVLYEVKDLATLTSPAYLARLNNPSAWTSKMMPHYRGMSRGLCVVAGSFGVGVGSSAYMVRFNSAWEAEALRAWLLEEALPALPAKRGIGSAHLLEGASAAPMTNEQRIRGTDAGVDSALLVMGYDAQALGELSRGALGKGELQRRGATDVVEGLYRIDYTLTHGEVDC